MQAHQGKYVRDLKAWELPRLDDLESEMVEALAIEARAIYGDRVRFGDELYRKLRERLRELTETAVNEVIEYWLKGLADGNDGRFPELCVEFPYLERDENTDALTLAYCVDNEDGTRTELNRTTLEAALLRLADHPSVRLPAERAQVVAAELRSLAARLESVLEPKSHT